MEAFPNKDPRMRQWLNLTPHFENGPQLWALPIVKHEANLIISPDMWRSWGNRNTRHLIYSGRTGGPEGICLLEGTRNEASSQSSLYLKANECLVALPFPSVKESDLILGMNLLSPKERGDVFSCVNPWCWAYIFNMNC